MIVTCEGCETSFHVQDHKIKSTGSKVRCSKCRHVFVAYPTADMETEEPLILQEVVSAAAVSEDPARVSAIDFQLDSFLREHAAEKAVGPAIAAEPEFLNVADLLAEEAPTSGQVKAARRGDDRKPVPALGLSIEGALEEGVPEAKPNPQAVAGRQQEPVVDFNLGVASASPTALDEPFPDLHELEISLDDLGPFEKTGKPAAEAAQPEDTSDPYELDFDLEKLASDGADAAHGFGADADLSALFGSAGTKGKEDASPSAGALDEPELELDPNLNEATPYQGLEAGSSAGIEDELDLSDLESMLEGLEDKVAIKPAPTEGIDLELDLQSVVAGEAPNGELQELDLTAIASPVEKDAANVDVGPEELDFSGLTGILDEKAHAEISADTKGATAEVDLVLDQQPPAEGLETAPKASLLIEEGPMLDIEKLLEEDEEKKRATSEIEVKATDEVFLMPTTESVREPAGSLEIEIEPVSDSHDSAAGPPSVSAALTAAATAAATAVAADSVKTATVSDDASTDQPLPAGGATAAQETEALRRAASLDERALPAERSGGIRKLLLAAAVLVVLAIAVLLIPQSLGVHIPYLRDVEVPFFGKIFQSEPEDTIGNLKIAVVQESIRAEFIENVRAGRICVILGQVRNNYDHPRSFIRVTGKLYDKSKAVVKMTSVFAGNVLSKEELAAQEFAAISARLKNKSGLNNLNMGLKPGAAIPFMVVFDGLPENLDEFSVEAAGSSN